MDADKTAGEETRRKLHKNVESSIEQVLATTSHDTPTIWTLAPPPITKTIPVWRARHAGHCWRSKDELISDVLLWTSTYGCAKAARPARTYIQQLCEDTGCNFEDLPEAMNDREKWRERIRDIRASGMIWWWWWYIYIYIYLYIHAHMHACKYKCMYALNQSKNAYRLSNTPTCTHSYLFMN